MIKSVFVAWRAGDAANGFWGPVGRLDHGINGYRFVYTRGALARKEFSPFPGMSDLYAFYESEELFPLFANRLLSPSRPEYEAFLRWGGFDLANPPDPMSLLGVTEGRKTTDAFEIIPCPPPDVDGCYINKFFLHGLRWMPTAAIKRIEGLRAGESLGLMPDPQNGYDRHAVAVRTALESERFWLGYVPRYLARDAKQLSAVRPPEALQVSVERVNLDAPLQQRLLCRMRACWPRDFAPCSGDEFQPLAASSAVSDLRLVS